MSTYYINQSLEILLEVVIDTGLDPVDAAIKQIYHKLPAGVISSWEADIESGKVHYSIPAGTLSEVGKHYFWVFLAFADGKSYTGTPVTIELYAPGTPIS